MSKFNNRIGEININNQGLTMKIINYRGAMDIDIQFEDNYVTYNRKYSDFKKGMIKNPNYYNKNRIKETNYNNYGSKMTIIEYNNADDIVVEFENGYKTKSRYSHFKEGKIKSPYDKTIYGVACLGEGKYKTTINNKRTIQYKYWHSMLIRCHDKKFKQNNPAYKDVTCCEEWLNFQNFAKWFEENYYEVEGEKIHLDKDILVKGNKIYSPKTCCFVPERINKLFEKTNITVNKGTFKSNKKYASRCNITDSYGNNKTIYLGIYNTIEEANKSYIDYKKNYIKNVANSYKHVIPTYVYNSIIKWLTIME